MSGIERPNNVIMSSEDLEQGVSIRGATIAPTQKRRYVEDFTKYIHISRFIGNYAVPFFVLSVLIAAVVIIILVSTIDHIKGFWFGVYVAIAATSIVVLTLAGYNIKKRYKRVPLERMIDYIFYRLISWTGMQLRKTKNINDKRILIENLLTIFYDYAKFKEINLWDRDENFNGLYKIIDAPKNQESIHLSIQLFTLLYKNLDQTYNEKGVLVIVKIFLPLLNISSNVHVCNAILSLIKKFMKDTQMNVFKSKVVNKTSLTRREEVIVNKSIFQHKHNVLDLFEVIWEGSLIKSQVAFNRRMPTIQNDQAMTEHRDEQIESLRALFTKQNQSGKDIDVETNNRLKSFALLKSSPNMFGKDIITQNHPFGLHSQLLAELKKKFTVDPNIEECNLLTTQLSPEMQKDLRQMQDYLRESKYVIQPSDNRLITLNGFMDKEAHEKLNDNHATRDSQHENIAKSIDDNQQEVVRAPQDIEYKVVVNERPSSKFWVRNSNQRESLDRIIPDINLDTIHDVDEENPENQADFNEIHGIRLSLREINAKKASFSLDKPANKSFISITHYEIPVIKKNDREDLSKEINQFLSIALESTSTFKKISSRDGITIYQKHNEGSPLVLVRCDAIVKGNMEVIFDAIFDLEKRSQWDSIFSRLKILKVFDEQTDAMYSFLKSPPCVTNRDFLQKRSLRRNMRGFDIVIAFVSYEDDEFPPVKNTIRANTVISGYGFKKIDENTTELVTVSQTDVRGSIPVWIINKTAATAPFSWVKRLEKAVKDFQAAK